MITDADCVDGAHRAVRDAGLHCRVRVRLETGDVFAQGVGSLDRVLVTAGVAGIPPQWFDRLSPSGVIVAPLARGGRYPFVVARRSSARSDTLLGRVLAVNDVPRITGSLSPPGLFHRGVLSAAGLCEVEGVPGVEFDPVAYDDLCLFLASEDWHVTCAEAEDAAFDPRRGTLTLVDPLDMTAAWIHRDGSISLTGNEHLRLRLIAMVQCWLAAGRPPARRWRCELREVAGVELFLPVDWRLGATRSPGVSQ
ncbi:hypothetical protein Lesp02_03990 [Lentzea sp. NBRC 105346]|nr:hypothetical protein Lesp02_03990 [Lentzea sp. NBRC 105346]